MLSEQDVRLVYLMALNRDPENADVIEFHRMAESLPALIYDIMKSDEFYYGNQELIYQLIRKGFNG